VKKIHEELGWALKIDVSDKSDGNEHKANLHRESLEGKGLEENKARVLAAVRKLESIWRPQKRIGFFAFMVRQLPFMGKEMWMTQGLAAAVLFLVIYRTMDGELEYLSIRHIPLLMGILAVVLVMTSVPLLLMSCRYQMQEVELASRISFPRLLMAKIMLLAVEYLVVFAFFAGLTTGVSGLSAGRMALYFLLPLFLACTGCVQIIRRTDGWEEVSQRVGVCVGYCACLGASLIILYHRMPVVYDNVRLWALFMVCVLPLLLISVYRWVKESGEVGERAAD